LQGSFEPDELWDYADGHGDYLGDSGAGHAAFRRQRRETYFQPDKTIHDLYETMKTTGGVDPLREFSEAARDELMALKSRLRVHDRRGLPRGVRNH